ncbi:MAG: lysophospholipid acyltransferase family protein [Acidimicrobiales bacterium]|jgi:1-acyl-sn-glycerol-3-phosphate acyltransferase|nr:lysophospholipid acyltransferase family protein [Acidimicrobiales bacterium]MDP6298623.1 lysophospholipid acyltransferase family protein [Acidimicrobiales bacterium]HJM27713.1 lysophospholipid acyltransferase family protein [Acidimicrobiales bacterium]HJM98465.1 lysophospholipid acyltransferase family protein [Acidimicrobiales bacterium]
MSTSSSELGERQRRALKIAASFWGRFFRKMVWYGIRVFLYPFFRVEGSGAHHLEIPGPVILAPVHRSNLDAPLLVVQTPRMIHALAKESLFSSKPVAWIMSALGGVPVNRGAADRDALKAAQSLLEEGASIIVFPEGTRQIGDVVGDVFDGAAFLAARTGAKVIPVGIGGTEHALPPGGKTPRRVRVRIVVGEPMELKNHDGGRVPTSVRKAFTEDLKHQLQEVFGESLEIKKN